MLLDQRILQKYPGPNAAQEVATQRVIDRMNYHEFLALFPSYVREELLRRAIYKDCELGDAVYRRGDKEDFMGAVVHGRLRMGMTVKDRKSVLLGLVEPGEIFGETSLLDGLPRTIDAIAEIPTCVILFRREEMLPALTAYPEAMLGMIRMLSHRLRFYTDTIDIMASNNLPMRLAHYLLRLAGDYGEEIGNRIVIRARLNQQSIGLQMAATRECINKNLKGLVLRGLIDVRGEDITILDPGGLRALAG